MLFMSAALGTNYYRFFATNSTGSAWAAPPASFVTVRLATIDNAGVSGIIQKETGKHDSLDHASLDTLIP